MGVIYIVHLTVFVCPEGKVFKENCFALKVEKKKIFPSLSLLLSGSLLRLMRSVLTLFLESIFGFMRRIYTWIKGTSAICQQDILCSKINRKPVYTQTTKSDT